VHSILEDSEAFSGFIELMSEDGLHTMVQVEDLVIKPLAPAAESDDRVMFTHTKFASAVPDGALASDGQQPSPYEIDLSMVCERLCYFYISKWATELTDEEWKNGPPHFLHLRNWLNHGKLLLIPFICLAVVSANFSSINADANLERSSPQCFQG
jgi:hybrid polyketide synthase/nonribosomal peptide synthetase ACE1